MQKSPISAAMLAVAGLVAATASATAGDLPSCPRGMTLEIVSATAWNCRVSGTTRPLGFGAVHARDRYMYAARNGCAPHRRLSLASSTTRLPDGRISWSVLLRCSQ
ncbi:MAG: hypothetical protein GC150_04790 [Rhizobiales bacterium]|nr:hypothetical protein [Hyphomicrobiales bacterium]